MWAAWISAGSRAVLRTGVRVRQVRHVDFVFGPLRGRSIGLRPQIKDVVGRCDRVRRFNLIGLRARHHCHDPAPFAIAARTHAGTRRVRALVADRRSPRADGKSAETPDATPSAVTFGRARDVYDVPFGRLKRQPLPRRHKSRRCVRPFSRQSIRGALTSIDNGVGIASLRRLEPVRMPRRPGDLRPAVNALISAIEANIRRRPCTSALPEHISYGHLGESQPRPHHR